ncbi:unnamed protein product [Prunus brigantina]
MGTIWQAPLVPYLKLNVDAAWLSNSGQTGIGIIIRNHLGELKGGKMCRTTAMSAVDAEARAVMEGLSFAADQGYSHIWVESDSKPLINCWGLGAVSLFGTYSGAEVEVFECSLELDPKRSQCCSRCSSGDCNSRDGYGSLGRSTPILSCSCSVPGWSPMPSVILPHLGLDPYHVDACCLCDASEELL